MAKETGLGWTTLNIDNAAGTPQDLRNDMTNLDFSNPYNVQEVTGLDKSAVERLLLLADFTGTTNGVFNPSANRLHAVFAGDLRVARTMGIVISAQVLNNEVFFTEYKLQRAAGGEFTAQIPFVLQNGSVPTWS